VRANFRTAITIPERSWVRFRDVISEFAATQQQQQHSQSQSGGVVSGVGGGIAGDVGDGDKEISATSLVDSAVTTSSVAAAANGSN